MASTLTAPSFSGLCKVKAWLEVTARTKRLILRGNPPATLSEGADPRKPLLAKGVSVGSETKLEERRPATVPERSR